MIEPETPEKPEPSTEDTYALAAGSGSAAILLFLHIALTGYLAFATFYIVKSWRTNVIGVPAMSWQFYFPAVLAILSYYPTDALTRGVARVARVAGMIAFLAIIAILSAHLVSGNGNTARIAASAALGTIMGGAAGALAGEWFRLGLRHLDDSSHRTIWPFDKFHSTAARITLGCLWTAMMLLLAKPVWQHDWLLIVVVITSALILAARMMRALRPTK